MAEPEKIPLPEDPPVTIAEDEVERLLSQAESLAGEIAAATGVDPTPGGGESPPVPASPLGGEPDPLAATEDVERTLSDLNNLVAEVQQQDSVGDPQVGPGVRVEEAPAAPAAAETASTAVKPPAAGHEPGFDFDPSTVGESTVRLDEPGGIGDSGDPMLDGITGPRLSDGETRPFKKVLAGWLIAFPARAKAAAASVPRALLRLLEIVDRPFGGISPSTKRLIGYLAVVTLIMGIASWTLPSLLDHNPYEKLGPD